MADCPNCGRSTLRTQDWACQWCGYPLVSGSFKQMPITYQEAKAERLHSWVTAETVVELESQEAGAVEEAEEAREPVAEAVEEVEETRGPVAEAAEEAEEPSEPEIVLITIEELNRICREDSEAAEARFANTILQVIGVVARIPPMQSIENPCLILTNAEKSVARTLLCVFDKQYEAAINKLSVGQMVTVQGKYDGCVINILLNDCVLVD
jgi:hypothetical protein